MSTTIKRTYDSRASAELAVEHLVQEHGIERTDIFLAPSGDDNSAGTQQSGGDAPAANADGRDDAPLGSGILLSVDVNDDATADLIDAALDALEAS